MDLLVEATNQVPRRPLTRTKPNLTLKDPDGSKPLTRKQKLFVEFYRRGLSAEKAALSAGYSPFTAKSASIEVLRHPRVQQEINRLDQMWLKDMSLDDPNWVIHKFASIASANLADFIEVEEDGTFKVDLNKANRDQMYAIQELSYDPEGRPKIRLEPRTKALTDLIKLYILKLEHNNNGSNGPLTISALDSIVQSVKNVTNVQINILPKDESKESLPALPAIAPESYPVGVGDPVAATTINSQ